MRKLKRVVEMYYLTQEGNAKLWDTIYVEIPRDTPENQIAETGDLFMIPAMGGKSYVVCGVYNIPSLEDSDEIMEYVILAVEEGEEFQEFVYMNGLPVPAHTEIGIELVNEEGEDEVVLYPGIFYANN
jgi:hypothetical protein